MELFSEDNKIEIEIIHNLKEIIDPEIAINIVDLGLIYKANHSNSHITITMTLSSKGCPMGDMIMNQIENTLKRYYSKCTIQIDLVWEPAWNRDFISKAGRKQLGII